MGNISLVTIILLLTLIAFLGWTAWRYYQVRKAAKFIDNAAFAELIHGGQLIDIREQSAYRTKHILGARNLPASQFNQSMSALRKDKPILLYDSSRSTSLPRVVLSLKKAGYTTIYVLKDGFDYWNGKVK